VVTDFAARCARDATLNPTSVSRRAKEIVDMQEQIGHDVMDYIEAEYPDWVNELAQSAWTRLVDGRELDPHQSPRERHALWRFSMRARSRRAWCRPA
jgi:hypothetical protein